MHYQTLVECYQQLENTSKRLEKVSILANFLKTIEKEELKKIVYLLQGRVFPDFDERKLGVSSRILLKAISSATGISQELIEKEWAKKGDLGAVAQEFIDKKKQKTLFNSSLTVKKVITNFEHLTLLGGEGTVQKKLLLLTELLTSATPLEARFIVRTGLEDLRIGVAGGVVRDAIASAFKQDISVVEGAYNLLVDYGEVAMLAKENKLSEVTLDPTRPMKVQLALIATNFEETFKALGSPVQLEYKLDGFRAIILSYDHHVAIYTRTQENVTKQFPDVIKAVESIKANSFIIDGEVVAHDGKRYLPFQTISQRIKRKYDITAMAKQFPVELNVFDLLYYNGDSLYNLSLKERRAILEKIVKEKKFIVVLTKKLVTSSIKEADLFYKKALKEGLEGVMVKNLNSLYRPGRYVGGWMKLKSILEPLDLLITKAEYGTGKRGGWLTSFMLSCNHRGELKEVGKVSTGIKEKSEGLTYQTLTHLLKPLILSQKGKEVTLKPKIILEVAYEEIQKSSSYTSGYGLRFPRVLRERGNEKTVEEINTLEDIKKIYYSQKGKK